MLNSTTHKEYDPLFIPLNLECFRSGGKTPEELAMIKSADMCISALVRASGISRQQAKTCFYYAVATHLLPDQLELIAILAIIGALGTGKSGLLAQLVKMVNLPKQIGAESQSTLRDELDGTVTALIDEGDKIYEPYLQRRYAKDTSQISFKVPVADDKGWQKVGAAIFGATIIVRRTPFSDPATKSRSIVIPTKYHPGTYEITEIDIDEIKKIAASVSPDLTSSHRIKNNWQPVQSVASALGDNEWLKYSEKQIEKDTQAMMAGQDFEPEEAILAALNTKMAEMRSSTY